MSGLDQVREGQRRDKAVVVGGDARMYLVVLMDAASDAMRLQRQSVLGTRTLRLQ